MPSLGRVALVAQRPIVITWTICRSVCSVHCGKTANRIRMPFDESRDETGSGVWSTGRGTLGGEFGACHCNQWGLYGVSVLRCNPVPKLLWANLLLSPKIVYAVEELKRAVGLTTERQKLFRRFIDKSIERWRHRSINQSINQFINQRYDERRL